MKPTLTVLVVVLLPLIASAQDGNSLSRFELCGTSCWIGFAADSMIHHGLVGQEKSPQEAQVRPPELQKEILYLGGRAARAPADAGRGATSADNGRLCRLLCASDGSADRRDAEELAGADEEEVDAGIIDLLSARPTVLVHRAK